LKSKLAPLTLKVSTYINKVYIEQLVDVLHKYEEKSLFFYADQSTQKLILGDNTNDLYKSL
jgi:hypothetical protein